MNDKKLCTTTASLLACATLTQGAWAAVLPVTTSTYQTQLVRCTDTNFGASSMGTCGGDALTAGSLTLSGGSMVVTVKGALAEPLNLYEVYWLPIGSPVTSAVLLDNFVTDCNGAASKASLKPIVKASDTRTAAGTKTNLYSKVGNTSAGNFLVYSRGPWAADTNGDCKPDTYNTIVSPADTSPANPLANPPVTPGIDDVQFISGFTNGMTGSSAGTGTPPNGTGTGSGTPPNGGGTGVPPNGSGMGTPPNGGGTGSGTPPNSGGTGTPPNVSGTGTPPNGGGVGTPPNGTGTGSGTPPSGGGTGTPPNGGGTGSGTPPNGGGTPAVPVNG